MLHIYNSLTKQNQRFAPLMPGEVSLYVCGMTVYDFCHIGHARVLVVFDIVTRFLRNLGYRVTYIRNITDIDDKIIHRAKENQESYQTLTSRFISAMHDDFAKLGVLPPTAEPCATAYIPQMVALIETLLNKGLAYIADNSDVYYNVSQFAPYGVLAHQDLAKLQSGARVATVDAKHHPLDFVLWKSAKPDEPHWSSPWGEGRPGWHIECSAMAMDALGPQIDIHGGGLDLAFPHHENEIAQSQGCSDKTFVNTWMHVGFVQVNQEKMSKSLGNFFTIRDVLTAYDPEVVRYFLMASHYRSPLNYSTENLASAKAALVRFYLCLRDFSQVDAKDWLDNPYAKRFHAAMMDDFNTPIALSVLFDLVREINRLQTDDMPSAVKHVSLLKYLANTILGILQQNPNDFLQATDEGESMDSLLPSIQQINTLVQQRLVARQTKNFAEADKIRADLLSMGIVLEDSEQSTQWRRQ